jgi:hypothetical protein
MNAVRNAIRDLVDRRLWPVAVLLVVAVAAVPVLLGSSEDAVTTAANPPQGIANPATAAPDAGQDSEVTLVTPAGTPGTRKGRVRNPFVQPARKADEAASGESAGESAGAGTGLPAGDGTTSITGGADTSTGTGGAGGARPSPGTTGGGGSGGSGDTKSDEDPGVYRIDLRFGETSGKPKVLRDVARLAPLPSADNPFFVFLGVLEDGETLVFLLSSDVKAEGDGKCRPSKASCQTIELQAGDTQFFDFAQEDGTVIQFQMDVLEVDRRDAKTATAAAASYARKSQVGQELLRMVAAANTANAFDAYRFRPDRGVLVRAKRKKRGARGASVRETAIRTVGGHLMRGNWPRTLSRKGEVRVWRTRARPPHAAR